MLKKILVISLAIISMISAVACSSGENSSSALDTESSLKEVAETEESTNGIDFDFTEMSPIVVYAQVSDMMVNPADYVGKTIKLEGEFYSTYYDVTDSVFSFIIISDATGCCPQGIEFRCTSDVVYPEQYSTVGLTGVFESYELDGFTYYRIVTDDISY